MTSYPEINSVIKMFGYHSPAFDKHEKKRITCMMRLVGFIIRKFDVLNDVIHILFKLVHWF